MVNKCGYMDKSEKRKMIISSGFYAEENLLDKSDLEIDYLYQLVTTTGNRLLPLYWMFSYRETSRNIEKEVFPNIALELFYIKLDGILHEIIAFYEPWLEVMLQIESTEGEEKLFCTKIRVIIDVCKELKSKFSKDELLYIDIQRQQACHICPRGFTYRSRDDSKSGREVIDTSYHSKKIGIVSIADVEAAVINVEKVFGDKRSFGLDVAKRIQNLSDLLLYAINQIR